MNEIIEDYYLKYIECLSTKDKKICDNLYLNNIPPLSPKKPLTISKEKQAWKYDINRGNFKKK